MERSWELAARQERSSTKLTAQKATPKCSGVPGCDKNILNISVDSIVFRDCLHRLDWLCAGFRAMLCGRCSCIQCDASAHCVLEYCMRKGTGFLVAEEWMERSWELAARQERSSTKLAAQKATPTCSGVPGCDKKNRSGSNLDYSKNRFKNK